MDDAIAAVLFAYRRIGADGAFSYRTVRASPPGGVAEVRAEITLPR